MKQWRQLSGCPLIVVQDPSTTICSTVEGTGTWEERLENAQIIASAPDLLALLVDLDADLDALGFGDEDAEINGADVVDLIASYREAIKTRTARARGIK